ncbi:MAG TPA: hypothetical protein VF706_00980, partial [Solirubrobacteraceae bacterium]
MPSTRKRAPARRSTARTSAGGRASGRGGGSRGRGRGGRRRSSRGGGLLGLGSLWPQGLPRLGVLDERGREVVGLALVALGVFMGFVLYGGWDGGHVGHGLAVALGWALGKARALAPLALVGAGGMLLLRQSLPFERSLLRDPRTIGGACLFAGVTLALAAGML